MQYFNIQTETANVVDITTMVRRGFEDDNLILVQAIGFRLEENETTRGM